MLIMLRKYKIKSCEYIKTMLKTESYTENKPKYTKYIQNAGLGQRGDRLYVKRRRLFNKRGEATMSL